MRPPLAAGTEEPPERLSFRMRLLLALLNAVIIGLCAWIAILLPLPILDDWLPAKNVIVAVGAVVLIGKTLFDTLFYDHFWP